MATNSSAPHCPNSSTTKTTNSCNRRIFSGFFRKRRSAKARTLCGVAHRFEFPSKKPNNSWMCT